MRSSAGGHPGLPEGSSFCGRELLGVISPGLALGRRGLEPLLMHVFTCSVCSSHLLSTYYVLGTGVNRCPGSALIEPVSGVGEPVFIEYSRSE